MKVSLVMASFNRTNLLDLGLWSISIQDIHHNLEIIVLNDGIIDNTENICKKYSNLNIRYIFTGTRNLNEVEKFRSPSFALNIGIKQSKGDIIIISSPEIFHLNNSIDKLINPFENDENILTTPEYLGFDNDGIVLNYLSKNLTLNLPENIVSSIEINTVVCKYRSTLPFCMGIYKQNLIDIGGYDEDFTGWAGDDDDLMGRLLLKGLKYQYCSAKVIHLYHPKAYNVEQKYNDVGYLHNLKLFQDRKGIIIRNQNRVWGKNE